MLQKRIWGGGLRGRECLTDGEPSRGLICRGLMCRRLWRRAPLTIGAPLGRKGGSPLTGNAERWFKKDSVNGASLSIWALCEENLEGGDPGKYVEKALETGISFHGGPAGEPGKGFVYRGR